MNPRSTQRSKFKSPQSNLEEKVFVALLCAAEELQTRVNRMLKRYTLTSTQYNALRILRGGGPGGLACAEVGDRMINREPDITRLLDRLQHRKLISRRREPADRRIIKACITQHGMELLEKLEQPVKEFHRRILGHISREHLGMFLDLLETIPRKHL